MTTAHRHPRHGITPVEHDEHEHGTRRDIGYIKVAHRRSRSSPAIEVALSYMVDDLGALFLPRC